MCKICETKPVYEFTNQRKVCKNCFIRWFQKKVLYTIKKFKMIKKGDVIGYVCGGDFRGVVLEDVLKWYEEKAPVEIVGLRGSPSNFPKIPKEVSKLAISNDINVISKKIIDSIIKKDVSKLKIRPVEARTIRPLYLFLDKEVLIYAKLRKLKFKKAKDKKQLVDELEIKHPEVKRAVVNSYLELYN